MRGCLILLLVLAGAVRAQDDPASDPGKALEEAKARLAALGDPSSDEAKRWREPVERRIRLLEELLRTEDERRALPPADDVETRRSAAQRRIEEQRALPPTSAVDLPTPDALAQYNRALADAREAREAARVAHEALAARRAQADAEQKGLPAREGDAKRRLEEYSKKEDDLSRYRAANARLELRVVRDRATLLADAAPRWAALAPVVELEMDVARLRADRAEQEQKLAAAAAAGLREQEERRIREQAEADRLAAARSSDPVERFRRNAAVEAAELRADAEALKSRIAAIEAANKERDDAIRFTRQERASLEGRLTLGDEGTASLLRRVLDRTRRSQQILERATLPEANAEAERNQAELVRVLDRLWLLQLPPDENDELQGLLSQVAAERHEEATLAFREATQEVVDWLRAKRAALERIEAQTGELVARVLQHEAELAASRAYIEERILWVRSDVPMDAAFAKQAAREFALFLSYRYERVWRPMGPRLLGMLAAAAGGVLVAFLLARRLRTRAKGMPAASGWRVALRKQGLWLLSSSLPAAAFFAAAFGARTADLPPAVGGSLPLVLELLALLLLVRGLAAWILAREGVAAAVLGLPAGVAAQLLRSVRLITLTALVVKVPAAVVASEAFDAAALSRLLDLAWYAAAGFALLLLLRRRGALVQQLTGPGGWMRGVFGLAYLSTALLVLLALVLGALGYAPGAAFLWENAVLTVVLIIVFAAFHTGLLRLVGTVAARVRARTMREEGADAAWQVSESVADQLTRLVATLVTVVAIVLFLRFWGLAELLTRMLSSVRLLELADEESLTLWNVLCGLLWIAGGHFVVRNLSAVYDSVVSPLLRRTDTAGRFVFLALSRYAILIVAYGAAMLALKISLSSIGWLLAAISFGVGFGLQEIVANFVSGLILLLERPIRVGDLIEVDGRAAVVDRINIRSTTVTNFDRQIIIIPNKQLITQNLTNWTRNDRLMRRQLLVGVAYGSDVEKVLRVLDEEVRRHPRVLADPPPVIRFARFGESSLDFEVFFFTVIEDGLPALADIHRQVYERFGREGIQIPFPQRDLHLRSGWEGPAGPPPRR